MKVRYKERNGREVPPREKWDWEMRTEIDKAIAMVEGKTGFRTGFEIWRNCELIITIGHNYYTTSIEIRPPEMDVIRRRSNWLNGYAYYCNGAFWGNFNRTKVELI